MNELFDMSRITERDLIEGLTKSGLCPEETLRPIKKRLAPDLTCLDHSYRGLIACLNCWEYAISNIRIEIY